MANDFSLDPYQVEEDNLAEQYKRALLKTLRPTPDMADLSARSQAGFDRAYGEQGMADVQAQRTALGQKVAQALPAALRGSLADQVSHPWLRTGANAEIDRRRKSALDREELDNLLAKFSSGGGAGGALPQSTGAAAGVDRPPRALALALQASGNPTHKALGEAIEKMYYTPHDPKQSVTYDNQGNAVRIPGADPAFGSQQDMIGDNQVVTITLPSGETKQMLRKDAKAAGLLAAAPGAAPTGPGTVPAPSPGGPANGPISPVSGPSGERPPPVFNLSGKLSPQEAMAIAKDVPNPVADPNPVPARPAGPGPGMPPPVGQQGAPNPALVKGYEENTKANVAAMQKMEETQADFGAVIAKLGHIRQMNQKPSYQGMGATAGPILEESVAALGGGTSPRYANTKAMEAAIQDLVGPILHQYGYNPSNRDLIQAQLRLPSMGSSAQAREEVAALVQRGMAAEQEVGQMTRQIFDQNRGQVSPQQAKQFAWKMYNDQRDAEEAKQKSGNPTGAANGQQGPLAASVRAEYDKTKKQLKEENSFGSAMWEKAKSLPGAIFSGAGVEGMVDAYGNMIEGGKEIFGQGDREKAMLELKRQEERAKTDPDYEQAKIFHSVANPVSVAGGAATTLPRALAAGAAFGALHPADSGGSQTWNAAVGAGLSGAGSLATRLLPTTRAAPALENAGLTPGKAAGPVQGTSAQLNPELVGSKVAAAAGMNESAALRQSKELTQVLMGEGKIAGDRLTREGVDVAYTAAKDAQRESLAAQPIKLPKPELKGLTDAVADLINTNGPQAFIKGSPLMEFLTKVTAQSQTKGGGRALRNVKTYDGEKLFHMWEEVAKLDKSKPAQTAAKKAIEDLIYGGAGKEVLDAFLGHQQTWRNVANIDRVWSAGGGSGTGVATGWINPSRLKLEAGRGPKDAVTDSITELVDLLGLRNVPTAAQSAESAPGVVREVVQGTIGKGMEAVDTFMQKWGGPGASPGVRRTVDALRAGSKTLPYTYQGRD